MTSAVRRIQVERGDRSYPVWLGPGCPAAVFAPPVRGRKVLLAADTNPAPLFGEEYRTGLKERAADVTLGVFKGGEAAKSLAAEEHLCREAVRAGLDRSSVFIALGGGVCGELTGLAASLYMRSVKFLRIPATVLAMADAAVGGKTGADLPEGKNPVGTFYQPSGALIDPDHLKTLSARQLANGFAEIAKTAMILDVDLFARLESPAEALLALFAAAGLEEVIADCCALKARMAAEEEHEAGRRALLNYGHTFAHALEAVTSCRAFAHGEAMTVGMTMAADLVCAKGVFTAAEAAHQENLLTAFHLSLTVAGARLSPEICSRPCAATRKASLNAFGSFCPSGPGMRKFSTASTTGCLRRRSADGCDDRS